MVETSKGRFCWYELMTTDPDGAQDFYERVVGWSTEGRDGADTPYTVWMNGDMPVGGVMELPKDAADAGAPPHWIAYVSTPSVDETIERARRFGAQVVWGPMDLEDVGWVAGLADPQGAQFALHQPEGEVPGHDGPPRPHDFSWHELATSDPEAALDFYFRLFGWSLKAEHDIGEMGVYREFTGGGLPLGGIFARPPEIPVSRWLLYVRVPDLDRAVDKVRALGGQVLNGPMEVPGGDRVAQCVDPQGAAFALHETIRA